MSELGVRAPGESWLESSAAAWERYPITFRDPGSGLCDEKLAYEGILRAAVELGTGAIRDHRDVSFHVGGAVVIDPSPYLPRASEPLDFYVDRLNRSVAGGAFTLLVNNFQEFSPELALCLRSFASDLMRRIGFMPAGSVSSHLMLARYATSPFGVHKDPNSVFTFMIRGQKTLRVWPFDTFAGRTQRPFAVHKQVNLYDLDYRPYRDAGIPLTARPGDVLYWPSTYWHVGEADGCEPHISLHLAFDVHADPRGEAVDLLAEAVEQSASEEDWVAGHALANMASSGPLEIPARLSGALTELGHAVHGSIRESIELLWLKRMSAQGFLSLPRVRPGEATDPVAAGNALTTDPVFPVYWRVGGSDLVLAAHGNVVRFPVRTWTEAFLECLAGGGLFRISQLAPSESTAQAEMLAVATKLVEIGALRRQI